MSQKPVEPGRIEKLAEAVSNRFPTPLSRMAGSFAAILLIGLITGLLFDSQSGALYKAWPTVLRWPSRQLTDLAKSWWILWSCAAIVVAGLIIRRRAIASGRRAARFAWQAALYVFASVAIAGIVVNLAKRAIGRARPEMFSTDGVLSFRPFAGNVDFESFPSGHSNTAGALAMSLALLFPRFRIAFLIGGLLLASTRVFVSAHYPSDMITGFLIGTWFAFLIAHAFARRDFLFDGTGPLPVVRQ